MIYPLNFEQKIGFDQIRSLIKKKCLCSLGEDKVEEMAFSDDFGNVNSLLDQVSEFMQIIQGENE